MKLKVYIDINRIRERLIDIKSHIGVKVLLMVKADAYGHGLKKVARAVADVVDAFGVMTLEEGLKLKNIALDDRIIVFAPSVREVERAIKNGFVIGLSCEAQLSKIERLIRCERVLASDVKLHIAIDSGMHRLGFCEDELRDVLLRLKSLGVNVKGVYSHLRCKSQAQISNFERASNLVLSAYPSAVRHLASSHTMKYKTLRYDMVRVGISAYEGAMRVESEVIEARRVSEGEFVSYGSFKLAKQTNVAVVFGGYADGVNREFPSKVYIRGKACKVLGKVCMDMFMVDCGDFLPSAGEKVLLTDGATISMAARERKTIPYTLMTCWRGRVKRIYEYDKGTSASGGKNGNRGDEH